MINTLAAMSRRLRNASRRSSGVKRFSMLTMASAGAAILTTVVENTLLVLSGHFSFFVKVKSYAHDEKNNKDAHDPV